MKARYSPEKIDYMFGGMNSVDEEFRCIIAKAMANLPMNVVEWASEKVFFVSSSDEYLAFSLYIKGWKHIQGFILLSEALRKKPEKTKTFIIAHEIAHQKLKHVSAVFSNLTNEEADAQEQEADDLALKWLSSDYKTERERFLKLRLKMKKQMAKLNDR
jgi:uncharacterized protein (DUF2342 family)